jgi:hypothetical protein
LAGYFGRHRSFGFWGFTAVALVLYPFGPFLVLLLLALTRERGVKTV